MDPTFDTPKNLDESIEENEKNDVNKLWFDEKKTTTTNNNLNGLEQTTLVNSQQSSSNQQQQQQRQDEETQSLNIYKRTYTTLDYPLVIKALANECDSIYGQDLVLNSILVSTSDNDGDSSASSSSSVGSKGKESNSKVEEEKNDILNMPLTATSLSGVHHRYGAVNEMQLLMEGRISGFITPKRRSSLSSSNSQGGNNNSQGGGKDR